MRLILVLLLGLLTTSCTFTFTYNNLGWMKDWYVDDYVDFSEQQQLLFDESFDQLHDWHRKQELPRYIEAVTNFKAVIASGDQVSEETINKHLDKFQGFANELLVEASPLIEKTLWELDNDQASSLIEAMNKDNAEFDERLNGENEEDILADREERSLKQYRNFIGKLSSAQKEMIKSSIVNIIDTDPHRLAHRKLWQEKFEFALMNKTTEGAFKEQMTPLIVNGFDLRTEQHNLDSESNKKVYRTLTTEIFNGMSNKQRQHLIDYLDDYIDDFTELTEKQT